MSMTKQQAITKIVEALPSLAPDRLQQVYNLVFDADHIVFIGGERFEHQDMVD